MMGKFSGFSRKLGLAFFLMYAQMSMAIENDQVTIEFNMNKQAVSLNAPVYVQFAVHNGLRQKVCFDLGHDRKSNFVITVHEPDGDTLSGLRLSEEGLGLLGDTCLNPKKSYSQRLILNQWYRFRTIGEYIIELSLDAPIRMQGEEVITADQSKKLTFQVVVEDKKYLEQTAINLLAQAKQSDVATAMEAALALSFITYPGAVPYLNELFDQGWVGQSDAIYGLGRIGNPDAVSALISIAKDRSSEWSSLAEYTLYRVFESTEDPQVKDLIKNALKVSSNQQ